MPRKARLAVANTPHHVMQDCIEGLSIFGDKDDYRTYLEKLISSAAENNTEILAYTLLPQRIHLVLQPKKEESLGNLIRQVHSFYSRYHNTKYNLKGNIWGERYASCPVEKAKLDAVVRYVERQPLSSRSKRKVENHDHTSAADHCSSKLSAVISDSWPSAAEKKKWSKFINSVPTEEETAEIEYCTRRGYAFGGKAFITRLEKKLGRPVAPKRARS